jgi:hypothetical protein
LTSIFVFLASSTSIISKRKTLINPFVERVLLSPQNELAEHLSLIVERKTLDSPKAGILMARFDPLRAVTIDVVFRPLDRPDHIGLLHASGFKAHILCHFLDLVKIHRVPPKYWVKSDSRPDLALLKISLNEFVSRAGRLQPNCLLRLSSCHLVFDSAFLLPASPSPARPWADAV